MHACVLTQSSELGTRFLIFGSLCKTSALRVLSTHLINDVAEGTVVDILKGARYSYCSVVLRNVLSLSARRPQID